MTTLYDDLAIPRDADEATIRKAYVAAAFEHHPDKGGDPDAFAKIQRAAVVLRDPVKRARYDETGQIDDEPNNTESRITSLLVNAFDRAIGKAGNIARVDIVGMTRHELEADVAECRGQLAELAKQTKMLAEVQRRLSRKKKGNDPLGAVLASRTQALATSKETGERHLAMLNEAIKRVGAYAWRVDVPEPPPAIYTDWIVR